MFVVNCYLLFCLLVLPFLAINEIVSVSVCYRRNACRADRQHLDYSEGQLWSCDVGDIWSKEIDCVVPNFTHIGAGLGYRTQKPQKCTFYTIFNISALQCQISSAVSY